MKNNFVVLIPSYEPDEQLIKVIDSLYKEEFPILVVNDGSSEQYDEVFNKIKDKVQYIKLNHNQGKGGALKEGYRNIQTLFPEAKYVITADGDGQHATSDIVKMSKLLEENDECVLGIRSFDKSVPFRSRFGNYFSQVTRGLATKTYLQDDQCGLRGFPVRYLKELSTIKGNRYNYEINQLTSFQLRNYPIIPMEIELIYPKDNNNKTHFKNVRDTWNIQCIIAFQGLPSLISLSILIAGLLLLYYFGYSFHHLIIFPAYLISACLTLLMWTILEPSQKPLNRVLKELLFTIIKMTSVFALMYLFIDAFNMSFFIAIPILAILACFYNLLLPRIFK